MLKPWFWPAEIRWVLYHGSPLAMFSRLPGWWAIQPDMLIGIIRRPKAGMYLTWNRGIGIYLTRMMKQPKDIHLWVWPCLLRFRMKAAIQEFAPDPKSMLLGNVRINTCHKLPWVCTCLCICMYNYIYIYCSWVNACMYTCMWVFFCICPAFAKWVPQPSMLKIMGRRQRQSLRNWWAWISADCSRHGDGR